MFDPPETLDVRDKHNGFTALTPQHSERSGYGIDTLWRPAAVAKRGTTGALVPGTVRRDDFYQTDRPVISAEYRLPGYRYRVKVWWQPDGTRIA